MNIELISLIKKLISFKSETDNNEECLNCLNYINEYLSKYGIKSEINNFNGHYSLIASNSKKEVYDLILSGHIDVVPANENQFQATEKDDFLYGRGSIDMKTQVATMIYCLAHYKGNKSICLALTSDEEIGGFNGTPKLIEKYNLNAKVAFIPDAGYDFQFINSERGVLQLNITVKGKSVHSAYANLGENAISKAYEIFQKLQSTLENNSPNQQTINLAKISTPNEVYNKVPDICNMLIDIRYNAFCKIQNVYEILDNSPAITYFVYAKADPFFTDINNDIIKKYLKICKNILQRDIEVIECTSASDARFFSAIGIPVIMMNPNGKGMHEIDECCEISSIEKFKTILCDFMEVL